MPAAAHKVHIYEIINRTRLESLLVLTVTGSAELLARTQAAGDEAVRKLTARLAAAQGHLRRARAEGEGGPAVVRSAGMHLAKLRRALTLMAGGADAQSAAKSVGVFWKTEREFLRQARAWSLRAVNPLSSADCSVRWAWA